MRISLLILIVFGVAGCESKPTRVATHPVSGQIFHDGQPASGVQVYLYPTSAPQVPIIPNQPHGTTDAEGRFYLSTFGNNDGAAEGGYQVVMFWPKPQGENSEESNEDRLLGWYSAMQSKFTIQVKPGSNDIPVWRLPKMTKSPQENTEGIPGKN